MDTHVATDSLIRDFMDEIHVERHKVDPRRVRAIAKELEAYYQKPLPRIAQEHWRSLPAQDAADQQAVERGSALEVTRYYQQTERYVFESSYVEAAHSRLAEFRELYLACRKFKPQRVLDFGGGAGGATLFLNARGIPCDYLDIPGKTFDFARYRFSQQGLRIQLLDGLQPLPADAYDVVIAMDVLEHLPALEQSLTHINRCLRAGGHLLSKSTFEAGGAHLPHNAVYGDMHALETLMNGCGFRYVGRVKTDPVSQVLRRWGWRSATCAIRISRVMKSGGNCLIHQKVGS